MALLLSMVLFVLAPILVIIVGRVIGSSVSTMAGLDELAEQSIVLRILLALRAGVTEEILYRAYPTERMKGLTGKTWVGALMGLVVFTILHVPGWGWGHSIGVVLPIGLILLGYTCGNETLP
ncbi:MAG TPA: CPBP family intramembrane metalloprotease [Candidatus Aminicenantes bacterium]|nr:CPBP family intramembrane metalloprotease [Candidatus Aminicenantes bacterium]